MVLDGVNDLSRLAQLPRDGLPVSHDHGGGIRVGKVGENMICTSNDEPIEAVLCEVRGFLKQSVIGSIGQARNRYPSQTEPGESCPKSLDHRDGRRQNAVRNLACFGE